MDKKDRDIRKTSSKRIFRILPLFGITTCLFVILLGFLLYIGRIDKTVLAHGLFEPYPKIQIKASVKDTVVDNILVEVGKKVKKGEILIRLKDQEQSYEKIAQLKERLKLADMDFDRLKRLSDKGYVAARDREEAELKIKILSQDLSVLQKRVNTLVIIAPFAGRVEEIPVKVGDQVHMGQELVLLAGSEETALRMWIKEEDSSEVALGQTIRIYSQVFYYRRYGIGMGNIIAIEQYPKVKDGENYVEVVAQITESPFPVRVGSRAKARIIIKRCAILKLLFGLDR